MSFTATLTATEVARKGWELAQVEKRKQHNPIQVTTQLEALADRAIAVQGAGTQADALAAFRTDATPTIVAATIAALV